MANALQNLSHIFHTLFFAAPRPINISTRILTSDDRFKRRLIFDVCFPNQKQVVFKSQYCTRCGFMAYSPRPTQEDIAAQYEFIAAHRHPQAMERVLALNEGDSYSVRNRKAIYELVTKAVTGKRLKVLDYGGMVGWYLIPFHEAGHECSVIDFTSVHLPEIRKIGNDLHDLPTDETFDVIICRAVLEHVLDPLLTVKLFHRCLKPGGVVYALAPNEIFGGVKRLGPDPATHVNFFSPKTFGLLFKMAGFDIECSGIDAWEPNMWVLARKTNHVTPVEITDEVDLTRELLHPGRWYSFRRLLTKFLARSFPEVR